MLHYCNKKVCENSQTYRSNTGNLTEKLHPLGEGGGSVLSPWNLSLAMPLGCHGT